MATELAHFELDVRHIRRKGSGKVGIPFGDLGGNVGRVIEADAVGFPPGAPGSAGQRRVMDVETGSMSSPLSQDLLS